jgi:hypothetical protein
VYITAGYDQLVVRLVLAARLGQLDVRVLFSAKKLAAAGIKKGSR